MSAILTGVLTGIAAEHGLPILKNVLTKTIGGKNAGIATEVAETVLRHAGGTPDLRADNPVLIEAAKQVEADLPAILAQYTAQMESMHQLQLAEMEKGSLWTWAWRPAGMWLMGGLILWSAVILPVTNAATGGNIATWAVRDIMGAFAAYAALYMGGHTIKDVFKNLSAPKRRNRRKNKQ